MKKRFMVLLITMIFTASSLFTAFANSEQAQTLPTYVSSSIIIDGKSIDTTNYVIQTDDGTLAMYPLRLISENLGSKVTWDKSKKSALITSTNGTISLNPDSDRVSINGINKSLSYPIDNKDSKLYVPVEFISEILGARVDLNPDTKTINIQKPDESLESLTLTDAEEKAQIKLASYLTSLELNRNFSGQVLVEQNGKILIDRSYGYSDYENRVKAFNTTTFSIGSVTKQFTAVAIAQLVEKNKIAYDDQVSKYLSDVPFGDKITLHQLLTHTSGLYNYTNISDVLNLKPSEMTYTKLISLIKDHPLDFEPGESWNYSNTGYLILGEIVEQVSGKTLPDYMEEAIFEPAGMKNTRISFDLDKKLVEANGYSGYMDVTPDQLDVSLLNMAYGAGFLCSTVEDLYKWNEALKAEKLVTSETLTKIFGKHAEIQGLGQYGYGWFIATGAFGEEISHGGNTIGFTSLNALFPEKNAQIVILTNKGYMDLETIKESIVDVLNGGSLTPLEERGAYNIPSTELSKYAGRFKNEDVEVTVANNSGELLVSFQGITLKLLAESKDRLYCRDMEADIKYTFDANGNATGIVLNAFGSSVACERVADKEYITLTDEQLLKYVGTYEIKDLLKFVVTVKDGKLFFQADGQPEFDVMPSSETEFESSIYGVVIKFDSKDTPTNFIINQSGQQFSAAKIK